MPNSAHNTIRRLRFAPIVLAVAALAGCGDVPTSTDAPLGSGQPVPLKLPRAVMA